MRITVHSTWGDLVRDLEQLPAKAEREMAATVAKHARAGNRRAQELARRSSGAHGKLYPRTFTAEPVTPTSWEYGPDAGMPQGGMSFEWGSRNQPPHMDLAQSADITGVLFARDVAEIPDRLFW